MTITAKIIADTICAGARITTMQLRYPRFVHAEFMTHRVFSRNASSSRAIPVERLIQDVIVDPAVPIHWGKNEPGMQAREEHDAPVVFRYDSVCAEDAWLRARDVAIDAARRYAKAGYHKQVVNRLLEPFSHINVVVTATDWENFFELRDHEDAQPEIQVLARAMRIAMADSEPTDERIHLPYCSNEDYSQLVMEFGFLGVELAAMKVSAARCARVSYLTHDGKVPLLAADLGLYERLAGGVPFHASPLEHQATYHGGRHANFEGWRSFRTEQGL